MGKKDTYEREPPLYEGRELILNAFKSRIFSIKETNGEGIKTFTCKQMFQILSIALALAKAATPLKIYLMRLENSYTLCIEQKNYRKSE